MSRNIAPPPRILKSQTSYSVAILRDEFIRHGYDVLRHSKWTMRTRETHLNFFVQYCMSQGYDDIRLMSNIVLDNFYVNYSKTRQKSTVNTARRIMKVFLKWVDEYKETPTIAKPDAIRLVKTRKKLPQAIDDKITSKVIQKAEEQQDALIIAVFREAGLRVGEIVSLRVEDVLDNQLRITESKDLEDRLVNITGMLALKLRKFAQDRDRLPQDWLFQNVYKGYGAKMTVGTIRLRVQKCYSDIAGVHIKPKQLRDSMALGLLKNGCDLVTIQTQLGHKDIQTTMIYLRIENSYFKDSYAKSMTKSFIAR